jgi:hypothetical protein
MFDKSVDNETQKLYSQTLYNTEGKLAPSSLVSTTTTYNSMFSKKNKSSYFSPHSSTIGTSSMGEVESKGTISMKSPRQNLSFIQTNDKASDDSKTRKSSQDIL